MAVFFGVPFGFKYRYMMNIRLLFFCFVCFFLFERGYGKAKSSDVPRFVFVRKRPDVKDVGIVHRLPGNVVKGVFLHVGEKIF